MIPLPENWQEMTPEHLVGGMLARARRAGRYLPLARGLMYAYIRDCVSDPDAIAEDGWPPELGGVFGFRSHRWIVPSQGKDIDVKWALNAAKQRGLSTIVSPPWKQLLIESEVWHGRDRKRVTVTTLGSLLGMRVFFLSAGERQAESKSLSRLFRWHNAYCKRHKLRATIRVDATS